LQYSLTEGYRTQRDIGVMDPGCTIAGAIINYQFFASEGSSVAYTADAAVTWGLVAGGYSTPPTTFQNAPPDPLNQPNEDWMFWEDTPISPVASTAHAVSSVGASNRGSGVVMVRSKRRLDELGDDIFLCANADTAAFGVATNLSVFFSTSVLFLLP